MSGLPTPKSLSELAEKLRDALSGETADIEHVKKIMEAYSSNPDDWRMFTAFDKHKYTRTLVDTGNGKFNLLILCWSEGQASSIHDHAGSHCFMKMLQGHLKETRYEWPDKGQSDEMVSTGHIDLAKNEVTYISDSLGLHRVENPSHTDKAVSLHLYSPPFDICHWFDERTSKKHTCKITFTSKAENGTVDCCK